LKRDSRLYIGKLASVPSNVPRGLQFVLFFCLLVFFAWFSFFFFSFFVFCVVVCGFGFVFLLGVTARATTSGCVLTVCFWLWAGTGRIASMVVLVPPQSPLALHPRAYSDQCVYSAEDVAYPFSPLREPLYAARIFSFPSEASLAVFTARQRFQRSVGCRSSNSRTWSLSHTCR